jgi:transposase
MRRFKTPNHQQIMLLPPNLDDWIGPRHPARFVRDCMELVDVSEFCAAYGRSGQPPYDPRMMLGILLYAQMRNVRSTRKIETMLQDDIGFRFIAANLQPDHDTIADFRSRHRERISLVFQQVVQIAAKAGAVRLNLCAIDGTKMRANASKSQRKSDKELQAEKEYIRKLIGDFLDESETVDAREDEEFGKGKNGYLLPDHLADKEARAKWLAEQFATLKDEQANEKEEDDDHKDPPAGRLERRLSKVRAAEKALIEKENRRTEFDPTGKRERDANRTRGKEYVQRINITDPDSRVMLLPDGRLSDAYNAQIAVDYEAGIIVAAAVVQDPNDQRQLEPLIGQIRQNTGWLPDHAVADTGYFNCKQMKKFPGVEFYIPPRRRTAKERADSESERMRERLETELGSKLFSCRKSLVEPVFGTFKQARGIWRFLMRGIEQVRAEWLLVCTAHNLLKMHKLGITPA